MRPKPLPSRPRPKIGSEANAKAKAWCTLSGVFPPLKVYEEMLTFSCIIMVELVLYYYYIHCESEKKQQNRLVTTAVCTVSSLLWRVVQSRSSASVNCRNGDGLTPLLLVTRDVDLFDRLSDQLAYVYAPVSVACELLALNGSFLTCFS